MHLDALEELTYESCIDSMMFQDYTSYCKTDIVPLYLGNLTLWNTDAKLTACEDGGVQMMAQCNTTSLSQPDTATSVPACDPCAFTLSFLFAKYEAYVQSLLEIIFKDMVENVAKTLFVAKNDALSDVNINAGQTLPINPPPIA